MAYLCVSDIYALINYVGFATWLSIGAAVLCLPWWDTRSKWKSFFLTMQNLSHFRLRYTQPNLVRPIRVNLFWPIIYLIATAFVVIVPMIASPVETGYGCLMILTSIPVYFIFVAWQSKPKSFQQAMGEYLCDASGFNVSYIEHLQELLTKNSKNYWWWFGQSLRRSSLLLIYFYFLFLNFSFASISLV